MKYRYYLRSFPPVPGTYPEKNVTEVVNFHKKEFVSIIRDTAWGYVGYTEPLSPGDIDKYNLISGECDG